MDIGPRVYTPCTPTKNYHKKILEKFIHVLPIVLHLRAKSHLPIESNKKDKILTELQP
jgi:hypothetical protein